MNSQTQQDDNHELTAINTARHRVYQLLSSLFAKELDQTRVDELSSAVAQAFWQQLATQGAFEPHVTAMVNTIAKLDSSEQQLELAADYCGLFLVGTRHSASPYASLYLGKEEDTLFGDEHQQIIEFLKQEKLQVKSDFVEPADHIAVILAYAGHLALQANDEQQLRFLQGYLANWLPNFVHKVKEADQGNFYSALVQLTQAWVDSELAGLAD